jgi:hypothetical protein
MLFIHSLNTAHLVVDASRHVRLNAGMGISVELICYLITFGESRLEAILSDVFAGFDWLRAKYYFHLIRSELHDRTSLEVCFDPSRRTYRLESHDRLEWDVQHLRNAIRSGTVRPEDYELFLPDSPSAWVQRERAKLENHFVAAMLNQLHHLEAAGRDQERDLLERLLKALPVNERVLGFSVRHTARKVSREVAEMQLEGFKRQFEVMGLVVPDSLGTCMTLH